jgi:hypothetical protein
MRDVLVELGLVEPRSRTDGDPDAPGYKLYTMRKTFAHRAAAAGMHVAELAAIMGHSPNSIPMLLARYYQIPESQKRRAHADARPADSFHEWRASQPSPLAALPRPLAYFERWAEGPRSAEARNRPSRQPWSRSLASGA